MKKLFGLLALMTVLTGVSVADEFTNLNFDSHWRGLHGGTRNRTHLTENEWRNNLTGTLTMDDEWNGLSFNFDILKKDFYDRNSDKSGRGWDNDVYFGKDFSYGSFIGDLKLGWKYKSRSYDGIYSNATGGHSNEFYFGPTVGFNLLGQEGTFSAQFVYFNENNLYQRDYKDGGTEGIGGNFDFNFNGSIYEGRFGTVSYNLDLKNHLRDATNTKKTGSDGKNSVYLDYDGIISYDTPRFYGFALGLDIENEFEKYTGSGELSNRFYVSPKASFKHTFQTAIGNIGVTPYIKWDAIDQGRWEDAYSSDKYSGYGDSKLRAGLGISLDRNN